MKALGWAVAIAGVGIAGLVMLAGLSTVHAKDILRINRKDPKLLAAIEEARKGLSTFEKELKNPKDGEGFAVKGTFETPQGKEYLWVRSPSYQAGKFTGTLDQQPIALVGKKKGDEVSFSEKDAVDWLIKDGTGTRGAFTEKALAGER